LNQDVIGYYLNIQRDLIGGKDGHCAGLTTMSPSCAHCLEILGVSTCCSPKGLSMPVMGQL